jgi:hypothetical protein
MNEITITIKEGYYIAWQQEGFSYTVPYLKKRRRFWFDKTVTKLPTYETLNWFERSTYDEIKQAAIKGLDIWVKRQRSFGLKTEGINIPLPKT